MTKVPDILVWILEEKLTDGSSVFNVEVHGTASSMPIRFECVDEAAAEAMADDFVNSISENTNQTADVAR